MEVVCNICSNKIKIENKITICFKENAINRSKEIRSFLKKTDIKRESTYLKVTEFIEKEWMVGDTKTTQEVLYQLGINEFSKGDFLRVLLDLSVCTGWLEKKFQRGSKGHIYTKLYDLSESCNLWNNKGWCKISFNDKGKFVINPQLTNYLKTIKKFEKEVE